MPMTPFLSRFPEVGVSETRSIIVPPGDALPKGEYGFIELYCDEPDCDCRRVTVVVVRPDTGWRPWATISYGWENAEFYRKWCGTSADDTSDMKGPYVDPLNEQSDYAFHLLKLFALALEAPGYEERLQRHYRMFRDDVNKNGKKRIVPRPTLGRRKRKHVNPHPR